MLVCSVAPHVGAWIETNTHHRLCSFARSLPMWERGLKPYLPNAFAKLRWSLPMWERGLKLRLKLGMSSGMRVAPHVGAWIETFRRRLLSCHHLSLPMWERGLKHKFLVDECRQTLSLPMWERGLKLCHSLVSNLVVGRSPCGSVD